MEKQQTVNNVINTNYYTIQRTKRTLIKHKTGVTSHCTEYIIADK